MACSASLRSLIASVVSADPSRVKTKGFVHHCHSLACAYLQQKRNVSGMAREGISLEDMALDCIAELFERNAEGRFERLVEYFSTVSWQEIDDDELFAATRRLVFTAVNDRLFEHYRESDPSLSRIIRGLKRAARKSRDVRLERFNHRHWVVLAGEGDVTGNKPLMPPEFLEGHLAGVVREGTTLVDMLDHTAQILRAQFVYRQAVPLTPLALSVRAAMARVQEAITDDEPGSPAERPYFAEELVEESIEHTVREVQRDKRSTYVETNKVDEQTYDTYCLAIRDRLLFLYTYRDGHDATHFRMLQRYMLGLSEADYRREHRSIFEYLFQCTHRALIERLQREMLQLR